MPLFFSQFSMVMLLVMPLLFWSSCDAPEPTTQAPLSPPVEAPPLAPEVAVPKTLKEKLLYQPRTLLDLTTGETAIAQYASDWCAAVQPLLEEEPIKEALETGQYRLIIKTNSLAYANNDVPPAGVELLRTQLLQCIHLTGVTPEYLQQQWYEESSAANRRRPVAYLWLEVDLPKEE